MIKVKRALMSVSDKDGIVPFAKSLKEFGVEILSTGGTARLLRENDIEVTDVSDYTGFPEIMNGRVKTLHPKIHGGLLALRDNPEHIKAMQENDIQQIDLVVVNLYPFQQTVAKPDVSLEDAIENIDIGGPSMIRAAAKNYHHVAVVVRNEDFDRVAKEMKANKGEISEQLSFELLIEAFKLTAVYDNAIANYMSTLGEDGLPSLLSLSFEKVQDLRYGENPHQQAAFYVESGASEPSVSTAKQLNGKELSFNNILDINAALEIVKEFTEPAVSVIKHTNPCGAAIGNDLCDTFERAYAGDPVSAFGSIIGLNRPVDAKTAEAIASPGRFVEAIIAPDFDADALEILTTKPKWGKDVRLLKVGPISPETRQKSSDIKRVVGGVLVQDNDLALLGDDGVKTVGKRKPTDEELVDLTFAWTMVKHIKSNAILFVKDRAIVGVGAGQMSRVDSTVIAAHKAGDKAKGAVLASDAFFPFRDGIDQAAEAGITAIIQPGGSKKDSEVIKAADEHNIAMLFTGMRHFMH